MEPVLHCTVNIGDDAGRRVIIVKTLRWNFFVHLHVQHILPEVIYAYINMCIHFNVDGKTYPFKVSVGD